MSGNFFADESVLLKRFQDGFVSAYPTVNVDYVGQANSAVAHKLVKFRVVRSTSRQSATKNESRRPMRNYGSVLVVITGPMGEGPGEVLEMADKIAAIFTGFRSGGLLCRPASLTGPVERGAFLEATVDVPFTSDYHIPVS